MKRHIVNTPTPRARQVYKQACVDYRKIWPLAVQPDRMSSVTFTHEEVVVLRYILQSWPTATIFAPLVKRVIEKIGPMGLNNVCPHCGNGSDDKMTECSQWGHSVPNSVEEL
jgi:hypothetical protein